jgi:hypothetical protein
MVASGIQSSVRNPPRYRTVTNAANRVHMREPTAARPVFVATVYAEFTTVTGRVAYRVTLTCGEPTRQIRSEVPHQQNIDRCGVRRVNNSDRAGGPVGPLK